MASGNQICKGNIADFPAPPIKIKINAQVRTDKPINEVDAQLKMAFPSGLFNVSKLQYLIDSNDLLGINEKLSRIAELNSTYADNLNLKVDNFLSLSSTPYLYRSTLNQLLDILVWFKNHMDKYPTPVHNNKFWSKKVSESNSSDIIYQRRKS